MANERDFDARRVLRWAVPVAIAGWLFVLLGLQKAPGRAYGSYLTAFAAAAATVIGALLFLMTTYVVRARWNVVIRTLNEAVVATMPLLALLFVPLLFGLENLYPWANRSLQLPEHELALMQHKQHYLNPSFFTVRALLYFSIWSGAAALLVRRAPARPSGEPLDAEPDLQRKKRNTSAVLLPLVSLASTFAAFDWLMSLQPFWVSSIFGVYYFAGGFVAAFGLLALLAWRGLRTGLLEGLVGPAHFHALGRLMFGFSIFWAYIAYFQLMLMRMANRPDEVAFYVPRLASGWGALLWIVAAIRFALPFFALAPRSVKLRPALMAGFGVLLLAGEYADMFWLVMPATGMTRPRPGLWDVAALAAISGSLVTYAAWRLRGKPLAPLDDPALQQSVAYRSPS
jgi:hypothetical protein